MAGSLSEQVRDVLSEPTDGMVPFTAERHTQEIAKVAEKATIAWLVSLADIDSRRVPEALGYTSTERYVAHTRQTTPQQAAEFTKISRLIARHVLTKKALVDGKFGLGHASLLAKASSKFAEQYGESEAELLLVASAQGFGRFSDTIARWINAADLEAAAADSAHRYDTRGVWLNRRLDGSGTGRFDLDPVAFSTVEEALDASAGKPDPQDGLVQRSLAQRRADGFQDMAMAYGPQEDGTQPCAEPHGRHNGATIEAVISLDLDGDSNTDGLPKLSGLLSDLYRTGPVSHTIIEQLSCDASWRRVLSGASQILDYSSPVADITPNQRRAVRHRDRHCQFHGCDRSWNWCDVHHIISRHDGGPTTMGNLVLMCRHHHSLLHQAGWSFTRDPHTGQTRTTSP